MAKMNTSHRYIYDAAPATLFRARTDAAVTATADSTEIVLDGLDGYWNTEGELADETFAVVINVTAITTSGDATYSFAVTGTDGAAGALTGVTLGTLGITAIGQYVVPVDVATIKQADNDFGGVKVALTVGGTTGKSVTYHAWLAQIKKA